MPEEKTRTEEREEQEKGRMAKVRSWVRAGDDPNITPPEDLFEPQYPSVNEP